MGFICAILALVSFILAVLDVKVQGYDMIAVGLMFWAGALLLGSSLPSWRSA